jgi:uncharacterized damage-inducible protein DinB
MEEEQLLDTWNIHNRINLYMLDAIAPEALGDVSASKGRSVGEEFAHMHNVRLMWLKSAAPELMEGLEKIEKEHSRDKGHLLNALSKSGEAIVVLLSTAFERGGRIKGFKPHAVAFMGYLISHESYHRGEIGIILTQAGHPLDKKVSYGLWEWGTR